MEEHHTAFKGITNGVLFSIPIWLLLLIAWSIL